MPRHNQAQTEHVSKDKIIEIVEKQYWPLGPKYKNVEVEIAYYLNRARALDEIIKEIREI